jgi:DNA topoisomerase-1
VAKTNLVVVESVAKARTIEKFLGRQYTVRACLGHVRDLPKSALGVDVEHDFTPKYLIPKEKKDVVKSLKGEAKTADTIYLATDPDREGEAIAWHLLSALDVGDKPVRRIEFHEVTKGAIQEALANPRGIDVKRVDAQQARRVLDRLVGYKLSPLLWAKVRPGLSAGRVQSVAVRLVVDREREIEAFQAVEYWTLEAELTKQRGSGRPNKTDTFRAAVVERDGHKLLVDVGADDEAGDSKRRTVAGFASQAEAESALADLERASYRVADVRRTERSRNPAAPFTTSTLQQEANRKLGFNARRTMRVAQQLYEGVDLGRRETVGLITYMRTDSVTVAASAVEEVRGLIVSRYGEEFLEPRPRVYKTRSRMAQEAHEAIRPTLAAQQPDDLRAHLTPEQFRLYDLIWKRFVASQMASARFDVTTVDVEANAPEKPRYLFRASGSILKFPGFLSVYREGRDDGEVDEDGRPRLPELSVDELLQLLQLLPEQHFTQPPARYTEATLVKALEEKGIGRPSTYAPILSTIQDRGYVELLEKRFEPTELGLIVNDLLVEQFPEIVNVEFTAELEEKLDDVAKGEEPWVPVVRSFYEPFDEKLEKVRDLVERRKLPAELTDEVCEKCGEHQMAIKLGRYGKFLACTGFPACRNAKPILTKAGVACPDCGGDLVERRGGKSKRLFFGCANYPACSFSTWYRPVMEPCPRCGWLQVEAGREKVRCLRCDPGPEQRRSGTTAARRSVATTTAGSAAKRDGRASPRRGASRPKAARAKGGKVVGRTGAR